MGNRETIHVEVRAVGGPTRLDRFLRDRFPDWGRQAVGALINAHRVRVNGRAVWLSSWLVEDGDQLEIRDPPSEKAPPPTELDDAWIIAVEGDLIALNKPAGVLSQRTRSRRPGDLLSLACDRFGPLTLFHRLDRDTSGVVLLTRPGPINRYLDAAFKEGRVEKRYLAAIPADNRLLAEGQINLRLGPHARRRDMMAVVERGGRRAVTCYRVLGEADGVQSVLLWPLTGRMHQLRVHLMTMGAPILGDRLYSPGPRQAKRLMLHACRIALPAADAFPARTYTASVPEDLIGELPRPLRAFVPAVLDE
jgi:23S rRNA pseudouridine1911/1915/1917 synthase